VELRFAGPAVMREKAIKALRSLGFVDSGELLDWRQVFPEQNPGGLIVGGRCKEGLTQQQLAELTGIPRRHISDMENGRRPIGKETAKKLARALKVDYRVFL
jgi:DNA-binding XRE family transcriptional regulator